MLVSLSITSTILGTLTRLARSSGTQLSATSIQAGFFLFSLILWIFTILLFNGFLRSVYLGEAEHYALDKLFKHGCHFFWRLFVFAILFGILYILVLLIANSLIRHFYQDVATQQIIRLIAVSISILFVNIVLIKVCLFLPATIITLDCKLFRSFKYLRNCKLSDVKLLIVIYCGNLMFSTLFSFLLNTIYENSYSIISFLCRAVVSILGTLIGLVVSIMAIRYVTSLNINTIKEILQMKLDDPRSYKLIT